MSFTFNQFEHDLLKTTEEFNSSQKQFQQQANIHNFHVLKNHENLENLHENFQCLKRQVVVDEYQVEANQIAIDDLERKVEEMEKVVNLMPLHVENEQRLAMYESAINLDAKIKELQSQCGVLESVIKDDSQLCRMYEDTFNQLMQIESRHDDVSLLLDQNQLKIEEILHQINRNPRNLKFFNDFCQ